LQKKRIGNYYCSEALFCCVNALKELIMKLKITLGLILLLFVFSCKKEATSNPQLIGKWTEVNATGIPGDGEVYFLNIASGPPYVQFGNAGEIQTNLFINCIKYSISGSKMVLTYNNGSAINNITYDYSIRQDTLIMNSEACSGCQVVLAKQ
jgi:hypothetical protein